MNYGAEHCHSNFCEMVFYGWGGWPSYSYWIIPGTVRDIDRCGWLVLP